MYLICSKTHNNYTESQTMRKYSELDRL